MIAASITVAGYTRNPTGGLVGSVGALIGSGLMAHVRSDWRRTVGILGAALSGATIGSQLTAYYIFTSLYKELDELQKKVLHNLPSKPAY